VIDHPEQVQSIKAQYWDPMWATSYKLDDCEVDKVMDGLNIDREAKNKYEMTRLQLEQAKQRMRANEKVPAQSEFHTNDEKGNELDADELVKSEESSEGEE
jgi:hypothetical protein